METVDCQFEVGTELYLVNHQIVVDFRPVMLLDIVVQRMIFFQMLELDFCQVDTDDVRRRIVFRDIVSEGAEQFGFTATSYPRYYLDIGSMYQIL